MIERAERLLGEEDLDPSGNLQAYLKGLIDKFEDAQNALTNFHQDEIENSQNYMDSSVEKWESERRDLFMNRDTALNNLTYWVESSERFLVERIMGT